MQKSVSSEYSYSIFAYFKSCPDRKCVTSSILQMRNQSTGSFGRAKLKIVLDPEQIPTTRISKSLTLNTLTGS